MSIHDYNERYAAYLIYIGLAAAFIGFIWLYVRAARSWGKWLWLPPAVFAFALVELRKAAGPLVVLGIGFLAAATPSIISRWVPVDLGPVDNIVNGERHLTLTGWDRTNYSILLQKADTVRLQMANPDVNDATLDFLAGFRNLRVLDLANTSITDSGLPDIAKLPALETLYLTNTRVTGPAVKEHFTNHPTLKMLWLRGTKVDRETANAIKAGKHGRRVEVDNK